MLLLLSKLVYVDEPFVDSVATLHHRADKVHIAVAKIAQIGVLTRRLHVCGLSDYKLAELVNEGTLSALEQPK